ncbi:hypothetical protein BDV19DRAFT_390979 [Aspergillus venezuelensis]
MAWAASWELIPWVIYLFVKHPKCLGGNKLPTLFILLGTIFWALSNSFQSIKGILAIFPTDPYRSAYDASLQYTVLYIVEIVTLLASFLFLLLLFMKGAKLGDIPSPAELPDDNSRVAAAGVVPTPFSAELEGSQSQVFETNAVDNQRFEVEAKQARFELGSEDLNGR